MTNAAERKARENNQWRRRPAGLRRLGGGMGGGNAFPHAEEGRAPGALPDVLPPRLEEEVERACERLPGAVDGPRSKAQLAGLCGKAIKAVPQRTWALKAQVLLMHT